MRDRSFTGHPKEPVAVKMTHGVLFALSLLVSCAASFAQEPLMKLDFSKPVPVADGFIGVSWRTPTPPSAALAGRRCTRI